MVPCLHEIASGIIMFKRNLNSGIIMFVHLDNGTIMILIHIFCTKTYLRTKSIIFRAILNPVNKNQENKIQVKVTKKCSFIPQLSSCADKKEQFHSD